MRTRPTSVTVGKQGQGFEFLGYRFEAGRRWVRHKSLQGAAGAYPDEDQAHARG